MKKNPECLESFRLAASFTKNARTAWRLILNSEINGNKLRVLLPAYIGYTEKEGSGVFDPIIDTASTYSFYKLNNDLSVDLEDFRDKIIRGVEVALIVHYFGFCRTDLAQVKKLCVEHNVVLVEDCAHAFNVFSEPGGVGSVGDYSFYSIHKYLPTKSGGLLKLNSLDKKLPVVPEHEIADPSVLCQFALSDFFEISQARKYKFERYYEGLKNVNGMEVIYDLAFGDIPQSFPVRISNGLREGLYFHLLDNGFETTALYYRLIDQICQAEYPESYEISQSILNFPVHQDVEVHQIDALCKVATEYLWRNNN